MSHHFSEDVRRDTRSLRLRFHCPFLRRNAESATRCRFGARNNFLRFVDVAASLSVVTETTMTESGNGAAPKKQFLFMTVHEAWGLSKEQEPVWDDTFKEGYVRGEYSEEESGVYSVLLHGALVEVRGGAKVQKATTFTQTVENYSMNWRQDLRMELTDASKELRIMLCKEKPREPTAKKSTSVVAACGTHLVHYDAVWDCLSRNFRQRHYGSCSN